MSVEAATAAVAQSEYLRVEAENTARIARREADKAQVLAAQSTARLHTFQEVVTVAQRAVDDNPTLDTMQGLIEAQALRYRIPDRGSHDNSRCAEGEREGIWVVAGCLRFPRDRVDTLPAGYQSSHQTCHARHREVEQLDGARVRWGPSVSVGCNLIGCSLKNITALVGVSLIYGR